MFPGKWLLSIHKKWSVLNVAVENQGWKQAWFEPIKLFKNIL
jgi:hypothetical protein